MPCTADHKPLQTNQNIEAADGLTLPEPVPTCQIDFKDEAPTAWERKPVGL